MSKFNLMVAAVVLGGGENIHNEMYLVNFMDECCVARDNTMNVLHPVYLDTDGSPKIAEFELHHICFDTRGTTVPDAAIEFNKVARANGTPVIYGAIHLVGKEVDKDEVFSAMRRSAGSMLDAKVIELSRCKTPEDIVKVFKSISITEPK